MKILLYTDNHFCSYSSILRDRGEKFSLRLENQIQSINWIEQLSVEQDCELEINLGDFFDKESLNSEEISALKEIKWNDIPKYFIVGNHEMGNNDLTYNSSNILSKIGNVVSKPMLVEDTYANLILIPYILESDRKSLSSYINDAYYSSHKTEFKDSPAIILTHNDIAGINYAGFESKVGFTLSDINNEADLYLNGHLHNCSDISSNIKLLGNLTGLNFSEDASKYGHYAYILDTKTLKLEKFENPFAFNFYKLEYPFIETLKQNAIISLKVKQSQVEEARDFIAQNNNIIKSKITIIPELIGQVNNREEIISTDHIQQFKDYILENVGCDDIIKEELGRL